MPKLPSNQPPRVTIRNIAARAGVSIGAVSTALNNRQVERSISAGTVQKIRQAAAELGYVPNLAARRLRSSGNEKNNIVLGLITSFETPIPMVNDFILTLRQAIEQSKLARSDTTVSTMIEMFSAGRLGEMPGLLRADRFNAGIIMNTTYEDEQVLKRSYVPYPVVLVNRVVPGYSAVIETPEAGARAAELLTQHKRERLAVLHRPLTQSTQTRVASFMKRTAELLGSPPLDVVAEAHSEMGGYLAMSAFLERRQDIDGLYIANHGLALGAYRAIREHGLSIPRQIAVLGVGDFENTLFCDPPLACVGVPFRDLAEKTCQLLFKQLDKGTVAPRTIVVPMVENLNKSLSMRLGPKAAPHPVLVD